MGQNKWFVYQIREVDRTKWGRSSADHSKTKWYRTGVVTASHLPVTRRDKQPRTLLIRFSKAENADWNILTSGTDAVTCLSALDLSLSLLLNLNLYLGLDRCELALHEIYRCAKHVWFDTTCFRSGIIGPNAVTTVNDQCSGWVKPIYVYDGRTQ